MSFQFSLQQAMDICKREKEEARKGYEEAEDAFKVVATALYHLLKQKEQFEQQMEKTLMEKATVSFLVSSEFYLQELDNQVYLQEQQTAEARKIMQTKQTRFQQCARSYKQYERLKEKKRSFYLEEEKRHDQNTMDELSVTRYKRLLV